MFVKVTQMGSHQKQEGRRMCVTENRAMSDASSCRDDKSRWTPGGLKLRCLHWGKPPVVVSCWKSKCRPTDCRTCSCHAPSLWSEEVRGRTRWEGRFSTTSSR